MHRQFNSNIRIKFQTQLHSTRTTKFIKSDNFKLIEIYIYLLDGELGIKKSFKVTSPLIGLYQLDEKRALILEETFISIIDFTGNILKSETFKMIEDFSLVNNILSMQTSDGIKTLSLSF